jgi:hypothetical protein
MKLIFVMILVLGIMAYSANGQIKGRKFADSAMVYKGFGMGELRLVYIIIVKL